MVHHSLLHNFLHNEPTRLIIGMWLRWDMRRITDIGCDLKEKMLCFWSDMCEKGTMNNHFGGVGRLEWLARTII
jgi:hypothetical protein